MTLGNQPQGPCPRENCDGTLLTDRRTEESVCNECYVCFGGHGEPLRDKRRRRTDDYKRTGQYDNSGITRLIGGFYAAYVGEGDYTLSELDTSALGTARASD